jgi:long-chain acyl-CoA synthetase
VREFANPALVTVDPSDTLGALVRRNAAERPDAVCFDRPDSTGGRRPVTSAEFLAEVEAVARGLHANGIRPGDRVGLMSRTRYEWTLLDFALWTAGAVVVPIYETSSSEQVLWILADSGATACFVETPLHQKTLDSVRPGLPGLTQVWNIGEGGVDDLVATGTALPASTLDEVRSQIDASSLATIIYTSGTTGRPKGCKLTHSNFLFDTYNVIEGMRDVFCVPGASTLLFLPLAHVFARIIEVACVHAGVRVSHTPSTARLLKDLETVQPTFLLAVPRVFERVFNASRQKAEDAGTAKLRIFDATADTAVAYSRSLDTGGPGIALRARHALFDRLVYGKLRAALGGRVDYAVSGGAALGERLGHFFRGVGVVVLEGYGLTETTAGSCINRPEVLRIGTVGQPVPGCAVRVEDDGEILLRGGHIFEGYWNDDAATAEVLDTDGWFRTGDMGTLDHDGFLRITGRKKELIVTAGGKNVAPAVLEDRLRAHPLVSQCVVVGDGRAYISALVTIDPETFETWKMGRGKPADADIASLVEDTELRRAVHDAIEEANHAVSRAEAIRRFTILPFDFTEENGYLTPSLKVRRNAVLANLSDEVGALYA